MRKYAIINPSVENIKKVMIFETDNGTYLFSYDSVEDVPGKGDYWFITLKEAEDFCAKKFNVEQEDWIAVEDPFENCQHDIIAPVRVKGRDIGNPQWGTFEKLIDGKWQEINIK